MPNTNTEEKLITEQELRMALGTALRTTNREIKVTSQHEKIILNKICLKLIQETLNQLGIKL